eukprot:TRINITY_DN11558_c0_g1_i1.p1 TRINITY_DN11558_c0_g1~~TRINITY_DN11558_c0_g1_i1.p1  ORF type:complete len:260 (-),score=79.72 TRINITY_DN11558_c0_g1_i1:247-1026(-)
MSMSTSESKTAYSDASEAAKCDATYQGFAGFFMVSEVCMMVLAAVAYLLMFMDVSKSSAVGKEHSKCLKKMMDDDAEDASVEHGAGSEKETECASGDEGVLSDEEDEPDDIALATVKKCTAESDDEEESQLERTTTRTPSPSVATRSCSGDSFDELRESLSATSSKSETLPTYRLDTFKVSLGNIAEQLGAGELGLEAAVDMVRLESCILPAGAGYGPFRGLTRQILAEAAGSERRERMAALMPALIDAGLVTYPGMSV